MTKALATLMLLLTFAFNADAACFPENKIYNPVGAKSVNTIDEASFNSVISKAEKYYGPIFEEKYDAKLKVVKKWEDSTVNAYAKQSGKTWEVHMFGGLARDEEVTEDGFLGVVCHEIGHHIGGAPKKKSWYGTRWASNEGQADYFATTKCLKRIFKDEHEKNLQIYKESKRTEDREIARKGCQEVYKSEAEIALCYRSALAGESLARLLGKLRGNPEVRFGEPSSEVVETTDHNHPQAQCRLDTYLQGSLCDKDYSLFPDDEDAAIGFCTSKDNYEVGLRPLCWFQPKEYGLER